MSKAPAQGQRQAGGLQKGHALIYVLFPLCHQCLHYEQKDVRLPAATTMIIKFLSGKKIMYMAKISIIIEKSIIIDFFQSPISIIIENFQYPFQ